MKRISLVCIALFFTLSTIAQSNRFSGEKLQKVEQLFRSSYKVNATGGALAIVQNGETVFSNTIGIANVEHQVPITNSTRFNIASNSKQFTTYLALMLEEEGKLSFQDDIRKYLPELSKLPQKVTIKQLTNHTHGLPNVDELAMLKGVEIMSHQQVVDMLLNTEQFSFNPGENYAYNNTGYVLLSEIITRVGRLPFEEQLKEKIFIPLGMKQTRVIGNSITVVEQKAYSYRQVEGKYVNYPVQSTTIGASGVYSTLDDLVLWARNFQQTTVGKSSYFDRMMMPTILKSGKQIDYGLGLQFEAYKGGNIVFHGGGTKSYRSYTLHVPAHNLSIVFLSNAGGFSGLDIVYGTLEMLLEEELNLSANTESLLAHDEVHAFAGTYEMFPGSYYSIIAEEGKLYFQPFGTSEKTLLIPLGNNRFNYPNMPYSTFIFYKDKFDYRFADFTYPCKKLDGERIGKAPVDLKKFTGIYQNKAHDITYELKLDNGELIAILDTKYEILLRPYNSTSVYSRASFFGKLDFVFNKKGEAVHFTLSGQNLDNIKFEKQVE